MKGKKQSEFCLFHFSVLANQEQSLEHTWLSRSREQCRCWSGSETSRLAWLTMEATCESRSTSQRGASAVPVTARCSWMQTVHLGRLPVLSGTFWNESAPSSYMQPCLFIQPSRRDVCSTPFVSIKIGKFGVISEACLHVKYGSPLKFVSSHTWHALSLLELFVLTNSHLPEKYSFFFLDWGGLYVLGLVFFFSCLGIL